MSAVSYDKHNSVKCLWDGKVTKITVGYKGKSKGKSNGKSKGKSVPLQAWSGSEGSRKLRFPDFMTTAQDGGKFVSLTHRPPLPQEMLLVLFSVRD